MVAIAMEKEEGRDGKEAGPTALTHQEKKSGRRLEGGVISDKWVNRWSCRSLNGLVQEEEQTWEGDGSQPCSGHV